MNSLPPEPLPKPQRELRKCRPFPARHETLWAAPVVLALLVICGWILATTLFQNIRVTPESLEALSQILIPAARIDLKPEPLERSLFVSLVLLGPLCIVAALAAVRWVQRKTSPNASSGSEKQSALVALGVLLTAVGALYLLHGRSMLLFYFFPGPTVDGAALVFGLAMLLWLVRGHRTGSGKKSCLLFCALAAFQALLVFLPRGLSIHTVLSEDPTLASSCWTIHFQAVAYAVTQVFADRPLLAGAPPLYGCYAIFLAPIFKLVGLSIFKFCLVMSGLLLAAQLAVLTVAWRFIRIRPMLLLCSLALFYTTAGTWAVNQGPFDPYFQYWPVRYLFPALSVPLFLWVTRRPTVTTLMALGGVCGLSLIWNLETGIAVTGAAICTLALEVLGQKLQGKPGRFWQLATISATAVVVFAFFQMLLRHQAGGVHPLHTTADYQQLFYVGGMTMMPLPMEPHPWFLLQIVYIIALTFGIHGFLFQRTRTNVLRVATYLAILGESLFIYYQGRSHDYNLLSVAWPGILVGFILADRLLRAIRAGLLSRDLQWLALPAAYFGVMTGCMLGIGLPTLWTQGVEHWRKTITATSDPMVEHIAFIRQHNGSDRECVILAGLQAAYFTETGFRSHYNAPGHTEWCFQSDIDALKKALVDTPAHHLFVEAKLLKQFDLTTVVAAHYKTVATTPDHKLTYMEPRGSLPPP